MLKLSMKLSTTCWEVVGGILTLSPPRAHQGFVRQICGQFHVVTGFHKPILSNINYRLSIISNIVIFRVYHVKFLSVNIKRQLFQNVLGRILQPDRSDEYMNSNIWRYTRHPTPVTLTLLLQIHNWHLLMDTAAIHVMGQSGHPRGSWIA